jgi:hypothetical protein
MEIVMKVYIGPYTNYIGPYQLAEKIFFWIDHRAILFDTDGVLENRWDVKACEKFGDWLDGNWVGKFCRWLDSKKERKINIRIDSYDTWSMDHTLALIVHPMLVQLKECNHGYFSSDPEDAPAIGAGDETDHGGSDTLALDRYNWIMDELIWTFETLKSDDYKSFYNEETDTYNLEGQQAHDERIRNGLRLFGKYYRALWD